VCPSGKCQRSLRELSWFCIRCISRICCWMRKTGSVCVFILYCDLTYWRALAYLYDMASQAVQLLRKDRFACFIVYNIRKQPRRSAAALVCMTILWHWCYQPVVADLVRIILASSEDITLHHEITMLRSERDPPKHVLIFYKVCIVLHNWRFTCLLGWYSPASINFPSVACSHQFRRWNTNTNYTISWW